MNDDFLVKIFEHNNWANLQILRACAGLDAEQLDARPQSATLGSIRETLTHLVAAQQGYLSLLTLPPEERQEVELTFAELETSARLSGEALLALAREEGGKLTQDWLRSKRGHLIEPWVVLTQIINHASEHREQINSMLSALELPHPDLDGWTYGESVQALIPPQK